MQFLYFFAAILINKTSFFSPHKIRPSDELVIDKNDCRVTRKFKSGISAPSFTLSYVLFPNYSSLYLETQRLL